MSYCTIAEVASDFKDITFDSDSSVTDTEVQEFIDQECEFINGMICRRYVAPIVELDSPSAFKILKRICIFLVADRVRHVLYIKTGRDVIDQDTKGLKSLSRNPRADLKMIADGKLKLGDAVEVSSDVGFDTFDVSCSDMTFDIKKQQW